ncbi:MAG: hypothetical protein PHT94_02640 [Candidatus Nanoarchaeia archaeon]|nr:hypothetical protein [Candidatus Nanoarchaeia archaeon]
MELFKKGDFHLYPIILLVTIIIISTGVISFFNSTKDDSTIQKNLSDDINNDGFDPKNDYDYAFQAAKGLLFNPLEENVSLDMINTYYPEELNNDNFFKKIINNFFNNNFFPIIFNDDLFFIKYDFLDKEIYNSSLEKIDEIYGTKTEDIIKSLKNQLEHNYDKKDFNSLRNFLIQNMFGFNDEKIVSSKFVKDFGYLSFSVGNIDKKYYIYIFDNKKLDVGIYDNEIVYYSFYINELDNGQYIKDKDFLLIKNYYGKGEYDNFYHYNYIEIYEKNIYDFYLKLLEKEIYPEKILFNSKLFYDTLEKSYNDSIDKIRTFLSDKYDAKIFKYLDHNTSEELKETSLEPEGILLNITHIKPYSESIIFYSKHYFNSLFDSIDLYQLNINNYNDILSEEIQNVFYVPAILYFSNFEKCDFNKFENNKKCFYLDNNYKDYRIILNNNEKNYSINQTINAIVKTDKGELFSKLINEN